MINLPTDIPNLLIWLDPDDGVRIDDVTGRVDQWWNLKEYPNIGRYSYFLQNTDDMQPELLPDQFPYGKSAIYGDGSRIMHFFSDPSTNVGSEFTLFLLAKAVHVCTSTDCNPVISFGGDGAENSEFNVWNDITAEVAGVSKSSPRRYWDAPLSTSEFETLSFRKSGDYVRNIDLWKNGALQADDFLYDAEAITNAVNRFYIFGGIDADGNTVFTNNIIACYILYSRALTDEEMRDVEDWIYRWFYEQHSFEMTPNQPMVQVQIGAPSMSAGRDVMPVWAYTRNLEVREASVEDIFPLGMGPVIVTSPVLDITTQKELTAVDVEAQPASAGSPELYMQREIDPDDVGVTPQVESPTLIDIATINPDDVGVTPQVESPTAIGPHYIDPDDVGVTPQVESPTAKLHIRISVDDASLRPIYVSKPAIKEPGIAIPDDAELPYTWVTRARIKATHHIDPDDVGVTPQVESPTLTIVSGRWHYILRDDAIMVAPRATIPILELYIRQHALHPRSISTRPEVRMPAAHAPHITVIVAVWVAVRGLRVEEASARQTSHTVNPLEITTRPVLIMEPRPYHEPIIEYEAGCDDTLIENPIPC